MSLTESKNAWRKRSVGPTSWGERLRTGSKNKYFMVSCDAHANEPVDYMTKRIDPKYRERVPHIRTDPDGTQWMITEGFAPLPVRIPAERTDLLPEKESFESYEVLQVYSDKMEPEDILRATTGRSLESRQRDREGEGVDAEIVFPMKGLMAWGSQDQDFVTAMCRVTNQWLLEEFKGSKKEFPMALIAPANVQEAIKDVQWAADNGFHGVMLPARPVFHFNNQPRFPLEYNDSRVFEPLWAAIEETGLPITLHVSTGQDPRGVGGKGGAITNYTMAVTTTMEPIVQMITSGVFERHKKLKLASIEAGIGWIPWILNQMDHGYKAHHMWVRPVIPDLPSDYFKQHCYSTFIEEEGSLELCMDMGLENNLLWSNDYPHPEGSFPHSTVTIERSLGKITEAQRVKVLGENAAKLFNIPRS